MAIKRVIVLTISVILAITLFVPALAATSTQEVYHTYQLDPSDPSNPLKNENITVYENVTLDAPTLVSSLVQYIHNSHKFTLSGFHIANLTDSTKNRAFTPSNIDGATYIFETGVVYEISAMYIDPVPYTALTQSKRRSPSIPFTLEYYKNITDDESDRFSQGSFYKLEAATIIDKVPSRKGYRFTYWTANSTGFGNRYLPGDKLQLVRDTYLYANWETVK